MGTEGTNIKRHTFTRHSPPKKERSPFPNRANMASSNQHVQQYQGQDRAGHPLKVILLEWVKGSEKVKVQTSTQFLCGLDNAMTFNYDIQIMTFKP
nr:hypothetical protein BaRGS_029794 [Batillaria attramentaria]